MTLEQEIDDRTAQRLKIAALFKARALQDVEPEELRLITPHYQQRISECRRLEHMHIVNLRRSIVLQDGSEKRLDGAYRYEPYERLGRDAGELVERPWDASGPFTESFTLKP